jgi:hypothetical protein
MRTMRHDFDAAEERARLAAADLSVAADHVIALHTIRLEDARDDVDFAVLSRQWTSYAQDRTLDHARDDVDFAGRARAEIGAISASRAAPPASPDQDAAAIEAELTARLLALAGECERRAAALRS